MKILLKLTIFLFCSYSVFAQDKVIYVNEDFVEITKEEFEKPSKLYYYLKFRENDTIYNAKVKSGIKEGQFSTEEFEQLKKELTFLSNRTIGDKSKIIINYYHGMDKCNSSGNRVGVGRKFRNLAKKAKRLKRVEQFFMFKSKQGLRYYGEGIDWIEDKNQVVSNLFFPFNFPCGSYVVIDKNGKYKAYRGEYNVDKVLKTR